MGSDKHYPEERPVHRVTVDGFWIDRAPVTNERFARFVEATGHLTFCRDPAQARGLSGRASRQAVRRVAGVRQAARQGRPARLHQLVALGAGAPTGGNRRARAAASPDATSTRSCTSASPTPRRSPAGTARSCRPRPNGSSPPAAASTARDYAWGDEFLPERPLPRQHLAGRLPVAEPEQGRLRGHVAGRRVSAQRLRARRHDRQRVGVDDRLVPAQAPGRSAQVVLHPAQPARSARRGQLRSLRRPRCGFHAR